MKNLLLITVFLSLLFSLSACSLLNPYEENVVCRNTDNLGKCLDVSDAYYEAASGQDIAPHFNQDGKSHKPHNKTRTASTTPDFLTQYKDGSGYTNYQDAEYRRLTSLLNSPEAPIVRPALTVRTLILPYRSEKSSNEYLYMPRFVFSILEKPSFIMGDYLLKEESNLYTTE